MTQDQIRLEASWKQHLLPQFEQDYMQNLRNYLLKRKRAGAVLYPASDEFFAAFEHTPFDQVKVVILGQDPYHGPGQAHGLCFSVPPGIAAPPSLKNILQEIHSDLGHPIPEHGTLTHWADQGVLLLNSVLTVEHGRAAAHQGQGWEIFTDAVISELNQHREHLVFMLWGSYAQRKGHVIDTSKHLVLKAPHPSPLSAYCGFFGCRHFSQANAYLTQHSQGAIDWQLTPTAP